MKQKITLNEEIRKIKSMMNLLKEDEFMDKSENSGDISDENIQILNQMKSDLETYNLKDLYKSGLVGGEPKNTYLADWEIYSDEVQLNFSTKDDKYHFDLKYDIKVSWRDEDFEHLNPTIEFYSYDGNNENIIYKGKDIFGISELKLSDGNDMSDIIYEYFQEKIWEKNEEDDGEPDYDGPDDDYDRYSHLRFGPEG